MGKLGDVHNGMDLHSAATQDPLWESIKSRTALRKINTKSSSMQMTAGLTCLQFVFAIYATFLLYCLSPSVDLSTGSARISWASEIARQWQNLLLSSSPKDAFFMESKQTLCEFEQIEFDQKKSNDTRMISLKTDLFREILRFQQTTRGCETLSQLMDLPSSSSMHEQTKVTVILNHFKRKTLCAQLDALLQQTLPFQNLWVLAFGSPLESNLRRIVKSYNNSKIHFVGSTFDFKYYGRFQLALQTEAADYVYILDDDMIPGRKMLQILVHAAGTEKYHNAVLGSIGRVLPFRQKDFSFPSYHKLGSREAGVYLPDPAYGIVVDRVVQVDFLSSGWFIPAEFVKALFIETPATFETGEDLHLSYQLQKYRDAASFVIPMDPNDKETWGDSDHRLAYVSETTIIHKNIVEIRDNQWWRAFSKGYVTQWAAMYPQQSDVFFYAHSLREILDLAPLILHFRSTFAKKAFVVVSGGSYCPCEDAAVMLGWKASSCHDRRFKIFDLELGSSARSSGSFHMQMVMEIISAMKGLIEIHSPALIITVPDIAAPVHEALVLASRNGNVTLVQMPGTSIQYALWMADVKTSALRQWNKMRISVNIVTQNRPQSLQRLLNSLINAHYLGDEIDLSFNMDNQVDAMTLQIVDSLNWPHGKKILRRRIVQAGLIRAVSESWYPATDDDFGLLLEDDIEVSPFYYMWLKYALLAYHYDAAIPELNAIALYTPRLVEVVKERPRWNATDFFKPIHPNTPYLHQLPCSWGALFFPKHWREFYKYMGMRFTADAKENPVQIPRSRTNGWQASWKKFLIDMMYLRGYVTLYPNFPNQSSFSTNHMEPGAHINASDNFLNHKREDFTVPLLQEDFSKLLPQQKLPPASKLPALNLFNQAISLKGLKAAGAKLGQDVLPCNQSQTVIVDHITGEPMSCNTF